MGEAAGHRFGQIIGEEIFEKAIYTLLKGFAEKHQLYLDKEETRRAALLECVQQLREGARLAQSREVANALSGHAYTIDRLAQEG